MSVLLIAGSPSEPSRSAALLDAAHTDLQAHGLRVQRLSVHDVSADALLRADFSDPSILAAVRQVAQARAIVIATPVYKAAYSGALKALLDVLPQTALQGKTVLPLATAGSPGHMLALDYALRPVLQALSARLVLQGVYATDAQLPRGPEGVRLDADVHERLKRGLDALLGELGHVKLQPAPTLAQAAA